MQDQFFQLVSSLTDLLHTEEILLCNFQGESSDFVRFNQNRVRQAGHVLQRFISMTLINGQRQTRISHSLSGDQSEDLSNLTHSLRNLREQLKFIPEDPYLNYATEVKDAIYNKNGSIPNSQEAVAQIIDAAQGLDMVGIWANGPIYRGFANSLGQRNWHQIASFHLDWSCYAHGDKAVKLNYADFDWQAQILHKKMQQAKQKLSLLELSAKTIDPGHYRVFIAPKAVREIVDMMSWGGFGVKSHRTSQSALLKMSKNDLRLNSQLNMTVNPNQGLEPCFTSEGFIKPEQLTLIEQGKLKDLLISPRSAKEYDLTINTGHETPQTLQMAPGDLATESAMTSLEKGIYINDLWYCNFSDRNQCKITGMTRFACFWVENGKIKSPLNVMRFDDSVFNIFGNQLLALTAEQETLFDSGSYGQRSISSYKLPGALVDQFNLSF